MSSSIEVLVLFFAKARELTGCSQSSLTVDSNTVSVGELRLLLFTTFDCLSPIRHHAIIAHNEEYKDDEAEVLTLNSGDEIAIIPPISGG